MTGKFLIHCEYERYPHERTEVRRGACEVRRATGTRGVPTTTRRRNPIVGDGGGFPQKGATKEVRENPVPVRAAAVTVIYGMLTWT